MSILAEALFRFYGNNNSRTRGLITSIVRRLEGGEFYSLTLRRIFKEYHKVDIGLYTHGGCFVPGQMDKHTSIGRYSSIAVTARAMNRNHPMEFKSMHALFFNPAFKNTSEELVDYIPLSIGNDVWIGHNAIMMPHVRKISDGAVIGAGAVVHHDVPAYAVVVGNPGRVVKYRFSTDTIQELLNGKWWEQSIEEIRPNISQFQRPYGRN
jgi:acetyltransferase-like isoleucine patch superfamily enzyme